MKKRILGLVLAVIMVFSFGAVVYGDDCYDLNCPPFIRSLPIIIETEPPAECD